MGDFLNFIELFQVSEERVIDRKHSDCIRPIFGVKSLSKFYTCIFLKKENCGMN